MYQSNVPVTHDAFHDRADEIAVLERAIRKLKAGSPSWIAIVGVRKVGKTSLLVELSRRLRAPDLFFVVLDAFDDQPISPAFFRAYALRTLEAVLSPGIGRSLLALASHPADFRAAIQGSEVFLRLSPDLRARIPEIPTAPLDATFLRFALDLPEILARELDLRGVVAIDEFQVLAELGPRSSLPDPIHAMRSAWQHHGRMGYFVSGSARTLLTDMVTSEHSPFFQHFTLMDLGPFSRVEAIRFLTERATDALPQAVAEQAVDVLGGHPFYLQMLGDALTSREDLSLKEALQGLLFSRNGRLALYFENTFQHAVGRSTALAAVLRSLAGGPRRLTDVSQDIGAPSGSTVRYVERLGEVVRRDDDGLYRLADPVFALWLRWRQPGGTVVPMQTLGDEAEKHVAAELAAMGFDLVYMSRASRGAFDLLATRAATQVGVQVKRSPLPLRFSAAAWSRMEAEAARLGWRWVISAVPPDGRVLFLDPSKARRGREVRIDEDAAFANLLAWTDAVAIKPWTP